MAYDIFLQHNTPEVVGTEPKRDLSDLKPLGDPGALDVRDVVEKDTTDRLHSKVFGCPYGLRLKPGILGLESPGDESGEALRLVLLTADTLEMFEPILKRFDVAEHHRSTGAESESVRCVHDVEPIVGHGFEWGDPFADVIDQDFAAAAGYGSEAGIFESDDDVGDGEVKDLLEVDNFAWAESVDVDFWELSFDMPKEVEIPAQAEFRMVSPLHEDLGASCGLGFLDFSVELLEREHVSIGLGFGSVEGAEFTINVADVGVIDVPINNERDDVIPATAIGGLLCDLAAAIRQSPEFFERERIEAESIRL